MLQSDIDAGLFTNTVTATGTDPKDNEVSETATVVVETEEASATLKVTKTAEPDGNVAVNDIVTYTVVITNEGNVTISNIALDDTLVNLKEAAFDLAPEASKTIEYTYKVLQSDIDAGLFTNTVTATGNDPKDNEVSETATVVVETEEASATLKVTKTADPDENVSSVRAGT